MPRPKSRRRLCVNPRVVYFKPRGVPLRALQTVELTREEAEVLWLIDQRDWDQHRAARHMDTSQSTIQRMIKSARKKIATAIMEGRAIAKGIG